MTSVKRIGLSMTKWVYEKYLAPYTGNKSKYVEEMFVRGIETSTDEFKDQKTKIVELLSQLRERTERIRQLEAQLGRLKQNTGKDTSNEENTAESAQNCAQCGANFTQGQKTYQNEGEEGDKRYCQACFLRRSATNTRKKG